jgi:hypothetical protein
MPTETYGITALGAAIATACAPDRPPSRPEPATDQDIVSRAHGPFAYDSWEGMTNIEKFDKLREDLNGLKGTIDRLGTELYKLQGLLEQHRHSSSDGSVLVQYNKNTF